MGLSAKCQKRTLRHVRAKSTCPSEADVAFQKKLRPFTLFRLKSFRLEHRSSCRSFKKLDERTTVGTIEKYKLRFPVGHSADAHQVSALTGAYTNEEPRYLQSTGFLLDPDGRVLNAVYSSGSIGRLVAEDVVGMVTYLKSKA